MTIMETGEQPIMEDSAATQGLDPNDPGGNAEGITYASLPALEDVTAITQVFASALTMLVRRRDEAYAAAIAHLDVEQEALSKEYAAIEEAASKLETFLPARARVSQYEADCLTLEGKREEAKAKLEEMKAAKRAPALMRERQQEIKARIATLEQEKKTEAHRVFHKWLDVEVRPIVRAGERAYFKLLRDVVESCDAFQTKTRTGRDGTPGNRGLFHWGNLLDLTGDAHSEAWDTAMRWYGNGGRR
jgi:hypothetical protein